MSKNIQEQQFEEDDAMDTTSDTTPQSTPQKKERAMDIASLLSPPEANKLEDSFSSPASASMSRTPSSMSATMASSQSQNYSSLPIKNSMPRLLPSPPISPQTAKDDVIRADEGTRDPPLFPAQEDAESVSKGPLFPQDDREAAIEQHIADNGPVCSREDYKLILDTFSRTSFCTTVFKEYKNDPMKWGRRELSILDWYAEQKRIAQRAAAGGVPAGKSSKSTKPRALAPAPEGGVRKKVVTPRVPRVPKVRRSPPQNVYDDFSSLAIDKSPKAPRAPINRNDFNFDTIQDVCPPTHNLGNNPKALKADWKGAPLDLSDDPDRHVLHIAEINLASTLRLSCATYLASKRRIFLARVDCLKIGKEFRRTDAQQACKIDVNKASKLWSAFEKVGWFDKAHFVGKTA